MGLIKSVISSAGSIMGDQWLDCIQPARMDNQTIMSIGVRAVKPGQKTGKHSASGAITDGSIVKVGENQMMLLVDGGKIIDYSAEPGYFEVKNANAPSLFSGDLEGVVSDAFNRFKFGGVNPLNQQVYYINLGEIQNIPFGTSAPINYYDEFYKLELFLRAHGYYSIKISDPIKFYVETVSKNANIVDINSFRDMYMMEFISAFQTAVGKFSVDGVRYSHLPSKNLEIAEHMEAALDEKWGKLRGMEIVSVAVSGLSPTEESRKIIDMRNQGVALSDAEIRAGYVQGAVARGLESAGSNPAGGATGYIGMNMGTSATGDIFASSNASAEQAQREKVQASPQAVGSWACPKCNSNASGKFCSNCGEPAPTDQFCSSCGKPVEPTDKFCKECGKPV